MCSIQVSGTYSVNGKSLCSCCQAKTKLLNFSRKQSTDSCPLINRPTFAYKLKRLFLVIMSVDTQKMSYNKREMGVDIWIKVGNI